MSPASSIKSRRLLAAVARHDGALFDFVCAHRTRALDRLMILASRSGDGLPYAAVGILGLVLGGEGGRALVTAAAVGGVASAASWAVKRVVARPRPTKTSALRVALIDPPDAWSFPSAHTATAVAAACTLGALLGPAALLAALAWSLAVGTSRVYVGAHYPLDVLMGGVLGAGVYAAAAGLARQAPALLASWGF